MKEVSEQVWDQIKHQVQDQVKNAHEDQILNPVRRQVCFRVLDLVGLQLYIPIRDQLE